MMEGQSTHHICKLRNTAKKQESPSAHILGRDGIARGWRRGKYARKITTQIHKHPSPGTTSAASCMIENSEFPSGQNCMNQAGIRSKVGI